MMKLMDCAEAALVSEAGADRVRLEMSGGSK